jgi:sugar phosphate isomerase/epimerase
MRPHPSIQLLCSTGAFSRESDHSGFQPILTYGPQVDADGFEVIFYSDWFEQAERIAAALKPSGLRFTAMHAEKSIGPLLGSGKAEDRDEAMRKLEANGTLAAELGSELIVLHLWGLPESDEHIERNLDALGECIDVAARHGVALAVETIPCVRADPLTVIRQVMERDPRCLVALDTEFLARHGQVEAAREADWLWKGDRVRHVHIKDYDGQMTTDDGRRRYLHPGEGEVDFARFFATLDRRHFRGFVSLEASSVQPNGSVDIARTKHALDTLRGLLDRAPAR